MSATMTMPATSPLISGCLKPWCVASYGCTRPHAAGDVRLHQGRFSTIAAVHGYNVDLYPIEFDNPDGTACSGPLVGLTMSTKNQICVEMSVATALQFSESLAAFAAGEVPVGSTASFHGKGCDEEPLDAAVTIERLDDVVFEYGSAGPRYMSFGAVKVVLRDPDQCEAEDQAGLSAPDAAALARYVAAVAVEVTR
jgi:hypothetical protein